MCPECKHELAAKDLVPVASWLWLRGKCRYCRAPIKDSPIVEAGTAALFGLSAVVLSHSTVWDGVILGLWLLALVLLIILAVYDLRWMLLPDKVMLPVFIVAVALAGSRALETHSWVALRGPILAAAVTGGAFLAIAVFSKGRGMGGGDIKLAVVMGLLLGLRGTAVAMMIAFDVAGILAVTLIILKKRGRRDQMPFGPFLVGGTIVAFLYGYPIVNWYLRANGL